MSATDMLTEAPHRARSLEELREIQSRLFLPQEVAASIEAWRPRPTDVVISPYGKSGTTWLQQIFHTLRTRGDMDFDDISRVVPWIETATSLGLDIEAPQRAEPRGFKSHLAYDRLPAGARAMVAFRDPKDVVVSMYRFLEGWFFEPGAVSLTEFVHYWIARRATGGDYWRHLISWWGQRDNPDVLVMTYEDMSADPKSSIRRVADFVGIGLDGALLQLTLEHSSLAFMLQHKDKFDDLMIRPVAERRCGLPPGSESAKVRTGKVGGHRQELPAEVVGALDANWRELVEPVLGFRSYAELRAALHTR